MKRCSFRLAVLTAACLLGLRSSQAQGLTSDTSMLSDGQLHVIMCGTGSPLPDAGRASACVAVVAGGETFLFDSGPGSWRQVALSRIPPQSVTSVFITHFHSDHIGDLGEVMTQSWIGGRQKPLEVFGPPGIENVVNGFVSAYSADRGYRVAHHSEEVLRSSAAVARAHEIQLEKADERKLALERGGVTITAIRVNHDPVSPAYGYRVDYHGRSVVISGDTIKSANLARGAKGVDILVHEVIAKDVILFAASNLEKTGDQRRTKLLRDILTYHSSPTDAAAVAAEAGVATLVFTHMVPPLNPPVTEQMFLRGVSEIFKGTVIVAKDGQRFDLPAKQ